MRLYYLDALRSFLILCVVLVHSAQVYNPNKTWLIYSENTSIFANYLIELLVLLIMPTFFMLAGYFSVISFMHSLQRNFLSKRLLRLLVPFVTIVSTLNILQAVLLVKLGWKHYILPSYVLNGDWIQHTWFLINLIVYTILIYILTKYFKKSTQLFVYILINRFNSLNIYLLIAFLPLVNIALMVLYKIIPHNILGINLTQIIAFIPFYAFGIFLFLSKTLLNKFSNISIVASATIVFISYLAINIFKIYDVLEYKLLYLYFKYLGTWFMSSLFFSLFYKYLNVKSQLLYKISDASYTIYLTHHILVVSFGILFIYFNFQIYLGLPFLFLISVLLSYYFHRKFVLSIPILQFLLNGKVK